MLLFNHVFIFSKKLKIFKENRKRNVYPGRKANFFLIFFWAGAKEWTKEWPITPPRQKMKDDLILPIFNYHHLFTSFHLRFRGVFGENFNYKFKKSILRVRKKKMMTDNGIFFIIFHHQGSVRRVYFNSKKYDLVSRYKHPCVVFHHFLSALPDC